MVFYQVTESILLLCKGVSQAGVKHTIKGLRTEEVNIFLKSVSLLKRL